MKLGLFWGLFQFVVCLTVVAAWGGEKMMIKVNDIEQLIKKYSRECFPPKTDREQFIAQIIVALTTGRVANKPETRCFLFCVMKNFNFMSAPDGKVNLPVLNSTVTTMTHPALQTIIMNNMELCAAVCDSTDPCINALKFGRCFAKQGLFVYVKLEESHFPTTKLPKKAQKVTPDTTLTTLPVPETTTTLVTTTPAAG